MELGLGYIIGYNSDSATIDIRTVNGATFSGVAYDVGMGFYSTPVLPLRNRISEDEESILQLGSWILFVRVSDTAIRIINIFNDDPTSIEMSNGTNITQSSRHVQDTLLALMSDGEALMSAPGKLRLDANGKVVRTPGSWALAKNNGDYIISNADSSAEIWVSHTGDVELSSVKYSLLGLNTRVYENESGDLNLEISGPGNEAKAAIQLSSDGEYSLSAQGASAYTSNGDYTVNARVINVESGSALNLKSPATNITSKSVDFTAETMSAIVKNLNIANQGYTNYTYGSSSDIVTGNRTISTGGAHNLTAGSATLSIAGTAIFISDSGGNVVLPDDATLQIMIKDVGIKISATGVVIIPGAAGTVKIGEAAASPVLHGSPSSPTVSESLFVEK